MKGFVVYPTYEVFENHAEVHLYGRAETGESFLSIHKFRPYFYVKKEDIEKSQKIIKADFEDSEFKNFADEPVCRVVFNVPKEMSSAKRELLDSGIVCYEADVRYAYRFLIDNGIKGCLELEGDYEKGKSVDRVYRDAKIKSSDYVPSLKLLSIDIETDMKGKEIFCISLYSDEISTVLIRSDETHDGAESFADERLLLEAFKDKILSLDPDVIIGWNLIDFDFKIIKDKMEYYKIPFVLGRNDWECKLDISTNFFQTSKARFPGRVVLDGIDLMKVSLISLPDYKLNTAAKEVLGKEKLITGDDRGDEIIKLFNENKKELIAYNLEDSKLVYEIFEKLNLMGLTIQRSKLTGMQLDRVSASIASFDSLYLKELRNRGIVAPNVAGDEYGERIKGGYVRESTPGIYDNILVFDFKSLYPSVIRTFNIDPVSYVPLKDIGNGEGLIEAPNGAHFKNTDGILPLLIERLWKERDQAKKKKDMISSNAIKITMNSMFGVLANPNCRFYNRDVANAITHFGQFLIKLCGEKIEELGHEIIYGDTDSLFIKINGIEYNDCSSKGKEIEKYINEFYKAYIKKNYDRESALELEFEKVYKKFFMPTVRGSSAGAKKRYAGIIEKDGKDEIKFVGLEVVRSDWTDLAKKFQYELIEHVFYGRPVEKYIKDFVEKLKSGDMDDLLVYRKSIRKEVSEYTKTTPPHIKAARKLGRESVGKISYVMTTDGPEPIEKIESKFDYDHYIEKQVKPIADSVLVFLKKKFEDVLEGKQKNLFDF